MGWGASNPEGGPQVEALFLTSKLDNNTFKNVELGGNNFLDRGQPSLL